MRSFTLVRPPVLVAAMLFLLSFLQTHAKVPVHCRMPDINSDVVPGLTRKFVEYCPEEAWPRGVGNTLVYFPVVYWFAVFTGRDLAITDLSSVGSVCRILNCGFPFTSEVKSKFPELKLSSSPRKVNYDLMQYFGGSKLLKNDIVNLNGYSATAFSGFLSVVANSSECVQKLTGCSRKNYTCIEHFAFRQHFPGGFRSEAMLPETVVGLSNSSRSALLLPPPPPDLPHSKAFDAGIHIRAQLKSLETKWAGNASLSAADFHLYNDTVFPQFNQFLTRRFYSGAGAGGYSAQSPPRVFVSVDDISLKHLLLRHLQSHRHPLQPLHVTFVNNSSPIKHAKHMGRQPTDPLTGLVPADQELVPTMFDWHGLSQAEFILSYRWVLLCSALFSSVFLLCCQSITLLLSD